MMNMNRNDHYQTPNMYSNQHQQPNNNNNNYSNNNTNRNYNNTNTNTNNNMNNNNNYRTPNLDSTSNNTPNNNNIPNNTPNNNNNENNNNPNLSPSPIEPDSILVNDVISNLKHLYRLAIDESLIILSPIQAAQYFDPPFNVSPYFDIIYNTITVLFVQIAEQSKEQYDKLIHDEYKIDQHLAKLESALIEQLSRGGSDINDHHDNNNNNTNDAHFNNHNNNNNNTNTNNSMISQLDTPVLIQTKQMAIEKQLEQIAFLEELLKQQEDENNALESRLTVLHSNTKKILSRNNQLVRQLAELKPICDDIQRIIENDQ